MNIAEIIQKRLFEGTNSDGLEFVTWIGEKNSFIIKSEGREYRVEIKEEEPQKMFTVTYDYQDITETHPRTISSINKVFESFKDDVGMIVIINNRTYFFESMEDYYDDYLTCWDEDGTAMRSQRQTFLDRLTSVM